MIIFPYQIMGTTRPCVCGATHRRTFNSLTILVPTSLVQGDQDQARQCDGLRVRYKLLLYWFVHHCHFAYLVACCARNTVAVVSEPPDLRNYVSISGIPSADRERT